MRHQPVDPGLDVGGCPVFICQHLGHSGNLENWDKYEFSVEEERFKLTHAWSPGGMMSEIMEVPLPEHHNL